MNAKTQAGFFGAHLELIAASEASCRAIPPLWPLASSVAVNPFLGQSDQTLVEVAATLGRVAGVEVTMPPAWYRAALLDGRIKDVDLAAALAAAPKGAPDDIAALKAAADAPEDAPQVIATVADLAGAVSGIDWPGFIADRIGGWAAGYFDRGQAVWQATQTQGAFASWQRFASRDLTPEITGLAGFASLVAGTPRHARAALVQACDALELQPGAAESYFHQLLLGLGGWSQLARQRLWQAELAGELNELTTDMLTIRLTWEQALLAQYGAQIAQHWSAAMAAHATSPAPSRAQIAATVLQEARERAVQRELASVFASAGQANAAGRPELQAVFCIDVRSEVFRRALESLDPAIQTYGFAGFFGIATAHTEFGSDVAEQRLPVLLRAGVNSAAHGTDTAGAEQSARLSARASRAWGRFKLAAVSSFAFVEATGPIYASKLLRDGFGMAKAGKAPPPTPQFDAAFALEERISAAVTILRAMSMTSKFAPLVLLIGHGAQVVNNPHASALQCGACGGYAGDVNARLLAGLLNEPAVRAGVAKAGIAIPDDTHFVGGLHDTTTDCVTLFDLQESAASNMAQAWLGAAAQLARTERALRLPRAKSAAALAHRGKNWAETRPEWALAGCNAFIAAQRIRTRGKPLSGRAFLHDYDWTKDTGFGVLELIMTAPVVVASWISLQYYGSVVAPEIFGAGNKLLHNVTGGIGVVEGGGGILRSGLPWQSVHDGAGLVHEPLRLTVCVEAPTKALDLILARHANVRALFDNRWLHLLTIDEKGTIAQRYVGDFKWQPFGP